MSVLRSYMNYVNILLWFFVKNICENLLFVFIVIIIIVFRFLKCYDLHHFILEKAKCMARLTVQTPTYVLFFAHFLHENPQKGRIWSEGQSGSLWSADSFKPVGVGMGVDGSLTAISWVNVSTSLCRFTVQLSDIYRRPWTEGSLLQEAKTVFRTG
jgi:hypothetical protein